MIHIVEDWLIAKYELPKVADLRIMPTEIVTTAYGRVLRESRKFKPLEELLKEIAGYAKENSSECMALAATDYMINGENSAILSAAIWKRLKEELGTVIAYGTMKLHKYTLEELEKYGLFDSYGFICGTKEDAPADFKEAWEEHEEYRKKMAELGID